MFSAASCLRQCSASIGLRLLQAPASRALSGTGLSTTRSPAGSTWPRTVAGESSAPFGMTGRRRNFSSGDLLSLKTNFEVSELEILRQKFLKLSGANASLDLERFTEALRTLGVDDEQEIQRLFYMFDEDKNGAVDFREFAVNLSILMRGSDDQRIAFVFKVLDEDEDGKINLGQYSRYLKANKVMDKATNDDILGVIIEHSYLRGDLDADGLLTIAEFKSAVSHARIVCPSPVSGLSLGDHLSPGEQELLSLLGNTISFQPGQELQDPSTAKNFFLVLSGSYITTPRSNPDIVLESGDARGTFLRQRSLFGGAPGRFLTLAQSQVTLLSIPNEPFLELVYHGHPAATSLTGKLGNTMLQRIKRFEKVLIENHLLDDEFKAEKESISAGWSLIYHSLGVNGKLRVEASKQIGSVEDLSVAYSPGVAEPCLAIARDPDMAFEYTCRGHLVGVVSNGTAVLGLGNIGALASKPVMEGKAVLFKKFAGLDSFDIELNEDDPQKLVDHIVALEPTFGGINIEDVKAPECFFVERECQKRMKICVMHDDAHGTSVIAGAGLLNALEIVQKRIEDIRVTVCGVGAAGFTCAKYFRRLGVKAENIVCVDKDGVVYKGRKDLVNDPELYLHFVALDTEKRTLADAVADCDVFLGLSAGNLLKPHLLKSMRRDPLIFALANPTPEISPQLALATRPDVIMATGRSDFPNQINNVLAFPYLFRGALDCRATSFNEDIKMACTTSIARIARGDREFGRDYIVPRPSDPRLLTTLPPAVIRAAMATGIASKRFTDAQLVDYEALLAREAYSRK